MADLLHDHHRRELEAGSAIAFDVIEERGYRTANRPSVNDDAPRAELKAAGIPMWAIGENWNFPGLIIPWYRATGERTALQYKPYSPIAVNGKKVKYASAKGHASSIDVHPRWTRGPEIVPPIRDISRPLHITEGIKKADSLTSRGLVTAALNGVFNWRSEAGTLGDWEDIALKGRTVVVVFDADCIENRMVLAAMKRLGKWLKSKRATVRYVYPPMELDGKPTKGIDDYFAAGGRWEQLQQHGTAPELLNGGTARFTDAGLAEEVAAEALEGRYCHTAGLGWLAYDGIRWTQCEESTVLEAVRQHHRLSLLAAMDARRAAIAKGDDRAASRYEAEEDGWMPYQSAGKLASVLKLAAGVAGVARHATDFDTDPDSLNTPAGLLHLPTLALEPHSPDQLVTKVTGVAWDPAAESPTFKAALLAVPEGVESYLQTIMGQALTGHPGKRLTMLSGGGANGKTAVMSTLYRAFGGYAMLVPNELLLHGAEKGGATPEKMTLRGLRLAYIEETPEDRRLNTQAVKSLVETPAVTGRALFKDITSFPSSHTIVLNTNYPPVVVETDHGTWRRMENVVFPFRFRTPGDGHGEWRPGDREGDATIKDRLADPESLRAALAWAVRGATAWYAARERSEAPSPPETVVAATAEWRYASDNVLRFLDQACSFDTPDAWVTTADLYAAFKEFSTLRSLGVASETTFMGRLLGHTGLPGKLEKVSRRTTVQGLSRRPGWVEPQVATRQRGVLGLRFLGPSE